MSASSTLTYFGAVDASAEDISHLDSQYVEGAVFQNLIGPNNRQGIQIVVAVKGAGKTALGRVTAKRFQGVTWVRNGETSAFRFDVPDKSERSGYLKNSLRVFLLEQLAEHLVKQRVITQTNFEKIRNGLLKVSQDVAEGTKIKTGIVDFDLKKLFDIAAHRDLDDAWETVCSTLEKALRDKPCLFILDDIDDYFRGIERSPPFTEALARAVRDINAETRINVSCVLLMKQGIWRAWFMHPQEYDKIKQVIDFLRWDLFRCATVLANRIAVKHQQPIPVAKHLDDLLPTLRLEFEGGDKEVIEAVELIFNHSINGPRDVVDLCNTVHRNFPNDKIMSANIDASMAQYSEEKLNAIHADYGDIYPEMSTFLQRVFDGHTAKMKGEELARWIDNVMVNETDTKPLADTGWFKDLTKNQAVKVLFDIGVVGVIGKNGETTFSIENASFSQNQLLSAELQVHAGYLSALGLSA